jgi:endonuclease/exonuclease/phosphatase family metal-dependent hydrolase
VLALACSAAVTIGCAVRAVPIEPLAERPCATAGRAVEWYGPARDDDRHRLSAWCESVGAAVVAEPRVSEAESARRSALSIRAREGGREGGELVVVTWNVHEGAGDLVRLVSSLRPAHVVVLVQEALRRDASVPRAYPRSVGVPKRERGAGAQGEDIVALADRLSMWLAYVPSMRNGRAAAEDRGNAILSTLPLSGARAIELPWVHQRRVAVMATVGEVSGASSRVGELDAGGKPGASGGGSGRGASDRVREGRGSSAGAWPLRVVSAHLDNRPGRASQAASLADWLRAFATDPTAPLVVGADLNTWFGAGEETVRRIAAVVPLVTECGNRPTFRFRRRLDFLFSTLPSSARRGCDVADDSLGSDHRFVRLRVAPPDSM